MESELDTVLAQVNAILKTVESPQATVRPTLLYEEGWLLRLVLSSVFRGVGCLPFPVQPGARWFSESLLYSAFLPKKHGDPMAETWTHADGVVGHFAFDEATKVGLALSPDAKQFVVVEAKIYSHLSRGTTRAPDYDQAARTVACMAETLKRAGRDLSEYASLGYYVFAPESQIRLGVFESAMRRESIAAKIAERVRGHDLHWSAHSREPWLQEWALPLVERMEIACEPWESQIGKIEAQDGIFGRSLRQFYGKCLVYNGRIERTEAEQPTS